MKFESKVVLSGILKHGFDGYAECCDLINEDVFDDFVHKCIFGAFTNLFNNGRKFTTAAVISECGRLGMDTDMRAQIEDALSEKCENLEDIRAFSNQMKNANLIRDAQNSFRASIDNLAKLDSTASVTDIFAVAEETIFGLIKRYSGSDESPGSLYERAVELLEEFKENPTDTVGLPTPWPLVNESIGGGLRTGVTLLGARSKGGKTAWGLMTGLFLAENDIPVLYLDTEMTKDNVIPRIVSNLSDVAIKEIETGKFSMDHLSQRDIDHGLAKLKSIKFDYKYVGGQSFKNILSTIRRWIYTDVGMDENGRANQCLIIYDYFKLMNSNDISNNVNESQAMGFQITQLTDFCNKYQVPCLSFVQLNREGITKEDTSVVFGSDKLLHLCNSLSILKVKPIEQIKIDGIDRGDRKFITLASRYGGEHVGEYIAMQARLDKSQMFEVGLQREITFDEYKKQESSNQIAV